MFRFPGFFDSNNHKKTVLKNRPVISYGPATVQPVRIPALFHIFAFMCAILSLCLPAHAAVAPYGPIANVDFVHRYITQKWGITVPINNGNIYQAVNVKYVLCAVDRANEILNGSPPTTTYCNHPLATLQVMNDASVIDAVDRLIVRDLYPGTGGEGELFQVTYNALNGQTFSLQISAKGSFQINWGDGNTQNISKANTTLTTYSKSYTSNGPKIITIVGVPTEYNSATSTPAISFYSSINKQRITKISGDLGSLFPILNATTTGSPRFYNTFNGLTGWTGSIPSNLFAGLHGAPVSYMFYQTFNGCTSLNGTIPSSLFNGLSGAPVSNLFYGTFANCTSLTGIGYGLFDDITGAAAGSFGQTFENCTGLTGPSAKSNGQFLYQKWATGGSWCYSNATGLSDFCSIPIAWGGSTDCPGGPPGVLVTDYRGMIYSLDANFNAAFPTWLNNQTPVINNLESDLVPAFGIYPLYWLQVTCNALDNVGWDQPVINVGSYGAFCWCRLKRRSDNANSLWAFENQSYSPDGCVRNCLSDCANSIINDPNWLDRFVF